jgi:hypothetical protein
MNGEKPTHRVYVVEDKGEGEGKQGFSRTQLFNVANIYAISAIISCIAGVFVLPLEKAVAVLDDLEASRPELARDAVGLRELLRREVRAPEHPHRACLDELVQRPERVCDRRRGVGDIRRVLSDEELRRLRERNR